MQGSWRRGATTCPSCTRSTYVPSGPGGLLDLARGKVRDLRARQLRRRIGWLDVDPRVRVLTVDRLEPSMALPPADVRIATFWRTSEVLANRADGTPTVQLMQAYETWAGASERVEAVWRLPWHKVVISRALAKTAACLGVPEELVHRVPNGLDHSTFRVSRPPNTRAPMVLALAHESPAKGLVDVEAVFHTIHAKQPDTRLVTFGGTRRPASLPGFVEHHRSPTGPILADLYNQATVFLCASRSEGWGFPSLEAMACGAALVSVANGGVDEFATHGESALVIPAGDGDGLSEAVLSLLHDPVTRSRLVACGVQRAKDFSWVASGEQFHRVVDQVAAVGGP